MDAELKRALEEKVRGGRRLTREDGLALYAADDLAWLGGLAHEARTRGHGDTGHFHPAAPGADSPADVPAVPEPDGDWAPVERAARAGGPAAVVLFPYGRAEPVASRVERLLRLRDLQDEAGGLVSVAPVRRAEEPPTGGAARAVATGAEVLTTFAVGRLLLDNVPHLTVRLDAHGELTAQLALQHGADDLDAAGPATGAEELAELVRDAGLRPVERDARYEAVRTHEGPDPARRETPQPMRV